MRTNFQTHILKQANMYAMAGDEWAGATEEQRPNRLQSLIIGKAMGRVQTGRQGIE